MKPNKRRRFPSFVALDRAMLKAKEWRLELSASEKLLYIYLKNKYVGINNGEIELHYSELADLMAPGTIARAFKGLEQKGWIEKTKFGGLYRYVNRYRLTGKYDRTLVSYNF
jgi:DNA-binding MarR family transcriptional regulator